jgi:hypothetical protein
MFGCRGNSGLKQRSALRVESLERRDLLAAVLSTYGEIDTVANFNGISGSEWSGAAYWTDGTDEFALLLESGDAGDTR